MVDTETVPTRDDGAPARSARVVVYVGLAIVGVVALMALAWGAANLLGASDAWDVEPGIAVTVVIEPGEDATSIFRLLEEADVARASALGAAAAAQETAGRLQAGTYQLMTGMDPDVVLGILVAGPEATADGRFVVLEGWTVDRIVEEVAVALDVSQGEVQRILRSGEVTSPYLPTVAGPVDDLDRWEGLLAAATYPISSTTTPVQLLTAMANEATARMERTDWSRLPALGVDRYEALTIASLIEREAGTDDERDLIASVIYNRLEAGMRLQIDATVIYALGYNPGRVTGSDLDIDSPWNTYRVDGLPPTPIGAPSVASLEAAADPATSTYLFYVLGSEDGSHLFADTYEGHQENIARARDAGVLP